jgi:DNA-binding IclR family transcriptional regulator
MANKQGKLIGSVQRALDILNTFDARKPELGNTEIADAINLPKSTAAGLIHTLEANGYLEQNPENRKYRLGYKLAERAGLFLNQYDLRRVAAPHLHALRDECNESVNLALRRGSDMVYIERMHGTNMLGFRSEIGKRERVHSTALGKAYLAFLPENEIRDFTTQHNFEPLTHNTITNIDLFLEDLACIRQRGYAIDDEENELGGRCVAAAIRDFDGKPVAAISISVPLQRIPDARVAELGEMVRRTAVRISRQIGLAPDYLD